MQKKTSIENKYKINNYSVSQFPQRIEIELASACNLQCSYCPRKYIDKSKGFMELSLFKRLIDEIAGYSQTVLVLHRRGESLLHPDFIKMCKYVEGKFREVQIATNATLLDDDKIRAIIDAIHFISFSIDTPDAFNKTRMPAQYDEVLAKILRFLDFNKGKVRTQVSMVKTAETPPDDPERFKKIWQGKVERIRIYEEHSRNGKFGSLARDRGQRLPCAMPFSEILIYYDGTVGRCNHDWIGMPAGDIRKTSIKEIWNSAYYNELRQQHKTLVITDTVCKDCDCWYPQRGKQGTGETIE